MMHTNELREELDELLRGELSAVESYRIALNQVERPQVVSNLREISMEHAQAASQLESEIRKIGGTPSNTSGPWGTFAKTVTGAASALGEKAVLKALKEGEEHGVKEYEELLVEGDIDVSYRELIQATLLPRQKAHIAMIDNCMRMLH